MFLYYYTSAETMKYILTNGDIYATHISYLNDSEEYINGLRELCDVIKDMPPGTDKDGNFNYEEAKREIPQLFSISFSKEADLLSQWFMYARESGVRLGMDFGRKKKQKLLVKRKLQPDKVDEKKSIALELKDVHYFTKIGMPLKEFKSERKRIIKTIEAYAKEMGIEDDFDSNRVRLWKGIAPYIKNYEFRQEKEVRLVYNASSDEDLVEYRNANGVMVPYVDIFRENGWPVVEIMVGPGRNQTRVFNSICHFVDHNDLIIPDIDQKKTMEYFVDGLSSYQVEERDINECKDLINETVEKGRGILTYKEQIYDVLRGKIGLDHAYLERNYYSRRGIIVRKSNVPYVYSN